MDKNFLLLKQVLFQNFNRSNLSKVCSKVYILFYLPQRNYVLQLHQIPELSVRLLNKKVLIRRIMNPDTHLNENCAKRIKSDDNQLAITIGTHDGTFHCDEALACYLLKQLHPGAEIIRSRDPKQYETCDFVVDVGGVYDHDKHRYDHHQKTFDHSMCTLTDNIKSTVKVSSAGLIYHHFGRLVLKKLLGNDDARIQFVYKRLYFSLIREIDGQDNGIPQFENDPLYDISSNLGAKVSRLNIPWNANRDDFNENALFEKAMQISGKEFLDQLEYLSLVEYPALKVVKKAIDSRYSLHSSGEIIELPQFVPWRSHYFDLEDEMNIESKPKYVLFEGQGSYRVQCVSLSPKSFVCRKFLPKSWRGLRDEELSKVAGINGCVFVHSNGFIGGNQTRDGVLQMAIKSLESVE